MPKAIWRAVGSHYGIVVQCEAADWVCGKPALHMYVATGPYRQADGNLFLPHPPIGVGISQSKEQAQVTAIAETIERYAQLEPPRKSQLVRSSYRDIQNQAISPSAFSVLSAAQYQDLDTYSPPDENKDIDWCPAYSLTHAREALIPASFVYYRLPCPPNDYLPELISTGTACHGLAGQALLAALCEVLERDAVMVWWLNRLPVRPLRLGDSSAHQLVQGALSDLPGYFSVYSLPSDSPFPVALAVFFGDENRDVPSAVVGAACRPRLADAATKALLEVGQMLQSLHGRRATRPASVRSLTDHGDYYAAQGGATILREALVEGEAINLRETDEAPADTGVLVDNAVRQLESHGREVLVVDLTPIDVATLGLRTVRVVVPGALDINVDERYVRLGSERAYSLPVKLGLATKRPTEGELNRLPVPLA